MFILLSLESLDSPKRLCRFDGRCVVVCRRIWIGPTLSVCLYAERFPSRRLQFPLHPQGNVDNGQEWPS